MSERCRGDGHLRADGTSRCHADSAMCSAQACVLKWLDGVGAWQPGGLSQQRDGGLGYATTSTSPRRKPRVTMAAILVGPESPHRQDESLPERVPLCHWIGQGIRRVTMHMRSRPPCPMRSRRRQSRSRSSARRSTPAATGVAAAQRHLKARLSQREKETDRRDGIEPPDGRDHRQRPAASKAPACW
jgi:hypothetical protein